MNPQIENNFKSHPASEDKIIAMGRVRDMLKQAAYSIDMNCPNSREKSLAMTNLEQAMFWANASIARDTVQ